MLVIVPLPFDRRRQSAVRAADPAIVPVAHVIVPNERFQLLHGIFLRIDPAVEQFAFHPSPHGFATRVVMATPTGAVHALRETKDAERVPELSACILTAAIGVTDRAAKPRIGFVCVPDCLHTERRFHIRCHCKPQRRQIKAVEQNRNV